MEYGDVPSGKIALANVSCLRKRNYYMRQMLLTTDESFRQDAASFGMFPQYTLQMFQGGCPREFSDGCHGVGTSRISQSRGGVF
eukprot:scaffold36006_cov168-Amphora_coffeaeformis.AAC.1